MSLCKEAINARHEPLPFPKAFDRVFHNSKDGDEDAENDSLKNRRIDQRLVFKATTEIDVYPFTIASFYGEGANPPTLAEGDRGERPGAGDTGGDGETQREDDRERDQHRGATRGRTHAAIIATARRL